MFGGGSSGPEMMIKSLFGIDPAQLREGFEGMQKAFVAYQADMEATKQAIERLEGRMGLIDRKLDALLMGAKLADVREALPHEGNGVSGAVAGALSDGR
jgi:hypothetical protein